MHSVPCTLVGHDIDHLNRSFVWPGMTVCMFILELWTNYLKGDGKSYYVVVKVDR